MARISSISVSFVVFLLFDQSFCDFPTNFLGNYLSDEEYLNRTLCRTPLCLKDSGRLIFDADHDSNKTAPCDDFKTFAMGEFFKHRVLNERYPVSGFYLDLYQQFLEKQKRMLLEPFEEKDPKMFKLLKSHFRQCINSSLVENQGSQHVIAYARRVGLLQLSSEDADQLDLKKSMGVLSDLAIRLFFDHMMTFCKNETRDVLCLKQIDYWTSSEIFEQTQILETLKGLKIDATYKARIVEDLSSYLKMKKTVQDQFKPNANDSVILTIKEMYEKYPSKQLDWLQMINSQLLSDSKRTLDDEVLIVNPQLLEGLYKLFVEHEEIFVSNVFATAWFTSITSLFTTYSFTLQDAQKFGTQRQEQRFEQCLRFYRTYMRPALEALSAASFYDESAQKSATELVELALADAIEYIKHDETIANQTRDNMIGKLKSAKLWVMFPPEILNFPKIDGLYNEIDLDGSESYFELSNEMQLHHWKLQMRPQNDWIRVLHKIVDRNIIFYYGDENILNAPIKRTLYPFFHPDRSRFYNMATFYSSTLSGINSGLRKAFPSTALLKLLPYEEMAYKSYVKWEDNGGIDLQLPSFKLTNRQMFWVCIVNTNALKYQKNAPESFGTDRRIVNDYFHVYLKQIPGFREAFGCGNLTATEEEQVLEFEAEKKLYFERLAKKRVKDAN